MGLGIFLAACVVIVIAIMVAHNKKIDKLHEAYRQALASGDKREALRRGRMYYNQLRTGKMTSQDEQAIANDLSTMS